MKLLFRFMTLRLVCIAIAAEIMSKKVKREMNDSKWVIL